MSVTQGFLKTLCEVDKLRAEHARLVASSERRESCFLASECHETRAALDAARAENAELMAANQHLVAECEKLRAALLGCIDLIEAWMAGPLMRHIQWIDPPPALRRAHEAMGSTPCPPPRA